MAARGAGILRAVLLVIPERLHILCLLALLLHLEEMAVKETAVILLVMAARAVAFLLVLVILGARAVLDSSQAAQTDKVTEEALLGIQVMEERDLVLKHLLMFVGAVVLGSWGARLGAIYPALVKAGLVAQTAVVFVVLVVCMEAVEAALLLAAAVAVAV